MTTATLGPPTVELTQRLECFGATVTMVAAGPDPDALRDALAAARAVALDIHRTLSRFEAGSELSRLNADRRRAVPASPLLRRLAEAARWAGEHTGGLVDATCLPAVEDAGYRAHFEPGADREGATWARALRAPAPLAGAWRTLRTDGASVVRPPGVRLDSGGLAKGMAADLMAEALRDCDAFAVDCAGDLRIGGTAGVTRRVAVAGPSAGDDPVHRFDLRAAAVATSGTTRRAWAGGHHLIDPRTGAPADTGLVQVTALAPTGLLAEVRAKAALLCGPDGAARWLPDGGATVHADGTALILEPGGVR